MGDHDIESEGEKISSAPVSYSEKPTAETMEHSPITLTEEDVCCLRDPQLRNLLTPLPRILGLGGRLIGSSCRF
jgi:hypothetical protein